MPQDGALINTTFQATPKLLALIKDLFRVLDPQNKLVIFPESWSHFQAKRTEAGANVWLHTYQNPNPHILFEDLRLMDADHLLRVGLYDPYHLEYQDRPYRDNPVRASHLTQFPQSNTPNQVMPCLTLRGFTDALLNELLYSPDDTLRQLNCYCRDFHQLAQYGPLSPAMLPSPQIVAKNKALQLRKQDAQQMARTSAEAYIKGWERAGVRIQANSDAVFQQRANFFR